MSDDTTLHVSQEHRLDQDYLRERKQRQKWQLGEAQPTDGHPSRRPNKPIGTAYSRALRRETHYQDHKSAKMGRIGHKHRPFVNTDASITDQETEDPDASTIEAPDAAYTYSYDRPTGASKGSQILGQALAKAVETYETKATEKLVKDEYELVKHEEDENTGSSTGEDDFELV